MESVLQNPDLLTEILSKLLLPRPRVSNFDCTSAHLTLTQVCSSWRQLVVETPMFWASIQFYCNKSKFSRFRYRVKQNLLAKMWLERSKSLPFSLIIFETTGKTPSSPHIPAQILQHSHRLHHLRLSMSIPSIIDLLSLWGHHEAKSSFPSLKSISVTHSKRMLHSIHKEAPTFEFQQFADIFPEVTTIRMMIGEMIFHWMPLFNPSRLTILDLVPDPYALDFPLPVEKILSVLQQCPSLREARFLCIDGGTYATDNLATTHKLLRTLALYEPSQGRPTIGHVFANLTAPNLISLSITSMMEDLTLDAWRMDPFCSPWSTTGMMDFVSRLSRPLQELILQFPSREIDVSLVGEVLLRNQSLRTFSCSSKYAIFSEMKAQEILRTIEREGRVPMAPKSLYYWYNAKKQGLTISSERVWWSDKLLGGVLYPK